MIIKKLGILSIGYVLAISLTCLSLLQFLVMVILSNIPVTAGVIQTMNPSLLVAFQGNMAWLTLASSFFSGLIGGFLMGVIVALIYNHITARLTGGLKIETKN